MRCLFLKRCGGFLPQQEYEVGYQQAMALIADGAAVEVKDEPAPEVPASAPAPEPEAAATSPPWTPPPPSYTPPFESDLMD